MFGVGRDLCGSSSPGPCWSRVTYRQVLNISREGDATTSLGSLFQGSVTLRVKKCFLVFNWNFLCFSLCPLPLVLSLGTTEKSLAKCSSVPSGRDAWEELWTWVGNMDSSHQWQWSAEIPALALHPNSLSSSSEQQLLTSVQILFIYITFGP